MPEFRTRALVLRSFDYGESDRLVHLYTEERGRISVMAKGARRSKRRFPGTLETFSLILARIFDSPRSSLMRIDGAKLIESCDGIANDLRRFAIGCQFVEILDRFTAENQGNPEFFHFAVGLMGVLRAEEPDRLLALLVTAKTLAWLGYSPQLARCAGCGVALGPFAARAEPVGFEPQQGGAVCPDCAEVAPPPVDARLLLALERGIRSPLRERAALGLGPRSIAVAEGLLGRFFRFHVGAELRSGPFLERVFAQSG